MIIQGGQVYGCDEESFAATHEAIPGEPDTYRKTALIWARRMDEPFDVLTKEGPERGDAGDWLAQQRVHGTDEQWFIPDEVFATSYEPA